METTNVFQISDIQALIGLVVFVGTVGIGWGKVKSSLQSIHDSLGEIKPDVKNIRERFIVVEERVKTLWKDEFAPAGSPRQLNERGIKILSESGIKTLIDKMKDGLFLSVKTKNVSNSYDAEQCILQTVNELKKDVSIVDALKVGAYSSGADIDTVLLVGGIYLRNLIFPELGFSIADLSNGSSGQ